MDRPVQECLTPTAVCSEGNVQNAAARQRGDRWFKVIQEAQISLCRWAEFARTLGMRSDLNQDLQRLKSQHAIDDGLIESLVTSKAQANAHLQFWTRLMWTVNGSLILIFALISGFGLRHMDGGFGWFGSIRPVLDGQRPTASAAGQVCGYRGGPKIRFAVKQTLETTQLLFPFQANHDVRQPKRS